MVDDEVVFQALLKELAKPKYKHGVVVDGFPRTEKQVAMISKWYDSLSGQSTQSTSFNFVTLFIDEQASVARQLSRGDSIRKLNEVRKTSGMPPLEERATDVCEKAARIRYSNFIQQHEAINKLSSRFHSVIVDASAPIDTVRQRLNSVCSQFPTPACPPRRSSMPSPPSIIIEESSQQQYAFA
jgi:adenylate kinase family enzyme